MGVDVRQAPGEAEGTTEEGYPERDTGPATSALGALRQKINEKRAQRYEDLPVRDLETIVVRYGAVPSDELAKIYKRRKRDGAESGILASADVLARACLGIYELDEDGEPQVDGKYLTPDDGEPLTFATLGLVEDRRAVSQVRALYVTDGDIIATANAVLRLSGYEGEDTGDILGE